MLKMTIFAESRKLSTYIRAEWMENGVFFCHSTSDNKVL